MHEDASVELEHMHLIAAAAGECRDIPADRAASGKGGISVGLVR